MNYEAPNISPGWELDWIVAAEVMGWTPNVPYPDPKYRNQLYWLRDDNVSVQRGNVITARRIRRLTYSMRNTPKFSTELRYAWQVVERMNSPPRNWHFWVSPNAEVSAVSGRSEFAVEGDTVPHAICLAALAATGVSVFARGGNR